MILYCTRIPIETVDLEGLSPEDKRELLRGVLRKKDHVSLKFGEFFLNDAPLVLDTDCGKDISDAAPLIGKVLTSQGASSYVFNDGGIVVGLEGDTVKVEYYSASSRDFYIKNIPIDSSEFNKLVSGGAKFVTVGAPKEIQGVARN